MKIFEDLLQRLFMVLETRWHDPRFLPVSILSGTAVTYLAVSEMARAVPTAGGGVLIFLTSALITTIWLLLHRLEKNKRDCIGILLAIRCDDDDHADRVRTDFIENLRRFLERGAGTYKFNLIVAPSYLAERINSVETARKYLVRTRCHLGLYGRVRRREMRGKEFHYLTFEGIVRHSPALPSVTENLAKDFSAILPHKVILPKESELFAFEAASEWADIAVRYVVGLAAYISGDVNYAEALFLDVEKRITRTPSPLPPIQDLARKVPMRLLSLYRDWLRYLIDEYIASRDRAILARADEVAQKVLRRDRRDYPALLTHAMSAFVFNRDVNKAEDLLRRCRGQLDMTWRYNQAFLAAYQGDLDEARKHYNGAFSGALINPNVPVQVEEFLREVLEEEPDRHQLWFCLGLVNYFTKDDVDAAERDFKSFLEKARGSFPLQEDEARQLVARCQARRDEEKSA